MGNTLEACKFCVVVVAVAVAVAVVVVVVAVDDHDEDEEDEENDEEEDDDDDDDDDNNDVDAKTEQHNLEDHCSGSLKFHQHIFFRPNKKSSAGFGYPRHRNNQRRRSYALAPARSKCRKHAARPSCFFVAQLCSTIILGMHV